MDLIAALAVIPLATFTTLAVLGAGSGEPPEWMLSDRIVSDNPVESNESSSSLILAGAQAVVAAGASAVSGLSQLKAADIDIPEAPLNEALELQENYQSVEPIVESEIIKEQQEDSIFDPSIFFDDDDTLTQSKPSYDEPSITGLE